MAEHPPQSPIVVRGTEILATDATILRPAPPAGAAPDAALRRGGRGADGPPARRRRRQKTREAGFHHHLVKPVDLAAVEAAVKEG